MRNLCSGETRAKITYQVSSGIKAAGEFNGPYGQIAGKPKSNMSRNQNSPLMFNSPKGVTAIRSLGYTQICIPYQGKIYGQRKLAMLW